MSGRMIPAAALPMFQEIYSGHPKMPFFAHYLEYLALHMPVPKLIPALEWLRSNRICGDRFIEYVRGECRCSGLEFVRQLTKRVEREKELRALFAKDLRA